MLYSSFQAQILTAKLKIFKGFDKFPQKKHKENRTIGCEKVQNALHLEAERAPVSGVQ
jgi:hypothetical protein